jgi:hypothetical protein
MSELIMAVLPAPNGEVHWLVVAGFLAVAMLPYCILVATIWSVIGFTKTVKQWIASNQSDDCPPVMHTRTAAERDAAIKAYRTAKMYGASDTVAKDYSSFTCVHCNSTDVNETGKYYSPFGQWAVTKCGNCDVTVLYQED